MRPLRVLLRSYVIVFPGGGDADSAPPSRWRVHCTAFGSRVRSAAFAFASLWALNAAAATVEVIEYYNASQDHYFISSLAADINALDSGQFKGWVRTGNDRSARIRQATAGASPVCRFYIPPAQGDSHFYSASPTECAQTAEHVPDVRRGIDGGDVRRPARCDHRRVSGRRHTGLSRVGQPRRHESSLHDRPQPARADGRARMGRRRLRSRPGDHVRAAAATPSPPCRRRARATIRTSRCPARRTACTCGIRTIAPRAYQKALANDVIGKDPTLCGASLVIYWSDVEATQGRLRLELR